jgi:hypothetical protein
MGAGRCTSGGYSSTGSRGGRRRGRWGRRRGKMEGKRVVGARSTSASLPVLPPTPALPRLPPTPALPPHPPLRLRAAPGQTAPGQGLPGGIRAPELHPHTHPPTAAGCKRPCGALPVAGMGEDQSRRKQLREREGGGGASPFLAAVSPPQGIHFLLNFPTRILTKIVELLLDNDA